MRSIVSVGRVLLLSLFALFAVACGDDESNVFVRGAADPRFAGPYPVGVTRVELFDAAQGRTQLTEVWYPADESARGQDPAPVESYVPPELAFLGDDATVPLVAVRDVPLSPDAPFPLVAFSHGSGGVRFQNTFQCEHLASHGFVVVAPDHEGNTFFDNSGNTADIAIARPLDIIFLLDAFSDFTLEPGHRFEGWVDTDKDFGVTGHSFGAFTSLAVASMDRRIAAALPMAFGTPVSDSYDAATLLMLATEDKTIGLSGNQAILDAFDAVPEPRYLAEIVDAGHYSFSFACQLNIPGPWDPDGCDSAMRFEDGSTFDFVSDLRVWDIVNTYSAALFGRYINGIEEYDEFLESNVDPEIVIYTADPADGSAGEEMEAP